MTKLEVPGWISECTSLLVMGLVCLLPVGSLSAHNVAEMPEPDDSALPVLFFSSEGPRFLHLQIRVDQKPIQSHLKQAAQQAFLDSDKDQSDSLNAAEFTALVEQDQFPFLNPENGESASKQFQSFDQQAPKQELSFEELLDGMQRRLGKAIRFFTPPNLANSRVPWSRFDLDENGAITNADFRSLMKEFHSQDRDEDETFSITELNSQETLAEQADANREFENQFIVVPNTPTRRYALAVNLLRQYGDTNDGESDEPGIPAKTLGLLKTDAKRFDLNADNRFARSELAVLLARPPAHLYVEIDLPYENLARPKVQLSAGKPRLRMRGQQEKPNLLKLSSKSYELELNAPISLVTSNDVVSLYALRFRMADADMNGYLDMTEFNGLQISADFKDVDANSDGMIFVDEVKTHIKNLGKKDPFSVTIILEDRSTRIFEALDTNRDRRLSKRELMQADKFFSTFDRNGDGEVRQVELASRYRMNVTLGSEESPYRQTKADTRQNNAQNQPETAPLRLPVANGPVWFRSMDRNRDGDVSWQEFPGKKSLFQTIDANDDNLISSQEADDYDNSTSKLNQNE